MSNITELRNVLAADDFVIVLPEKESESQALIKILKGQVGCNLLDQVKNDQSRLQDINQAAIKILAGQQTLEEEIFFTDTTPQMLKQSIEGEKARLRERFGLILGAVASIFSRLFGTIGETHKIIASIATAPTFADPVLNLGGLVPAQLEFESSDIDQTLEYKDL